MCSQPFSLTMIGRPQPHALDIMHRARTPIALWQPPESASGAVPTILLKFREISFLNRL
jgi:hypothetical protein